MKKFLYSIFIVVMLVPMCIFSGCGDQKINSFGMFSYNGKVLPDYAVAEISATQAKEIIASNRGNVATIMSLDLTPLGVNPSGTQNPLPNNSLVDSIIIKYASVEIETKYYVTGNDEPHIKRDFLQGTDFKSVIEKNQFDPFSQLVAKGVVIFDELIDYMEEKNEEFVNSDISKIAPFKTIFSYHKDTSGNVVIQTRDFAEIPSSVGGGIGCSYRQDTEIVYDSENKMTKWQTSLGVYSATPEGTLKQGYILEVNVNWNLKV